jgi:hypothetical protein
VGVKASGCVVCEPTPVESTVHPFGPIEFLKINTNDGTVETLDDLELPETGGGLWQSGAFAADNNIYYMPSFARRIMRLNPDNDTLSSVGDDLGGGGFKYLGTAVGNDDWVYSIPSNAKRIIKFDPTNPDTTSTVGEEAEEEFRCGNGVLVADGDIYSVNRLVKYCRLILQAVTIPGLGIQSIQEMERNGATLLLELISVFIGLLLLPIVYSNLTPRHNNHHRSWGVTWGVVKRIGNGWVEL